MTAAAFTRVKKKSLGKVLAESKTTLLPKFLHNPEEINVVEKDVD